VSTTKKQIGFSGDSNIVPRKNQKVEAYSLFTKSDIELFKAGKHYSLSQRLGAHLISFNNSQGTYFAVWEPSARSVSVVGGFNDWTDGSHPLIPRMDGSGIWEGFIPGLDKGTLYKYKTHSKNGNKSVEKPDPFTSCSVSSSANASLVWKTAFSWKDNTWMTKRSSRIKEDKPLSVYEIHLGSWIMGDGENKSLEYKKLTQHLVSYVKGMGFTHVKLLSMIKPFQISPKEDHPNTFFSPQSEFKSPEEFMYLVNELHINNIGVIIDWFSNENSDLVFSNSKSIVENTQVKSILISKALFWLQEYHVDGLQITGLDSFHCPNDIELETTKIEESENSIVIDFLRTFNEVIVTDFPEILTILADKIQLKGITRSIEIGGLGFGMAFMTNWVQSALKYFNRDCFFRQPYLSEITTNSLHLFTEKFMLPLSHKEVMSGKASLLNKMSGDRWQRFANLKLLYSYMYMLPGTKLLFMGGEFGQFNEWDYSKSLNWDLLEEDSHKGIQNLTKDLNQLYRSQPALFQKGSNHEGFEWLDLDKHSDSVLAFLRNGHHLENELLVVLNLTPIPRENYRIGVNRDGIWSILLNSDSTTYNGSNMSNATSCTAEDISSNNKKYSISLNLPPLGCLILKRV